MPSPYKALLVKAGLVEPGVSDYILFASASDFTTIQCPPAGDVEITLAHVFASGLGFMKLMCSPSKNKLGATLQGEPGSLNLQQKLNIFVPGSKKELHKLIKLVKNDSLIVLVKDADCDVNQYYQLGCDCNFAYFIGENGWESGTTKDGQKGYNLTIEYPSSAIQIYSGAITMHP